MDYKTTPDEEAKAIIIEELLQTEEKLKAMNILQTPDNIIYFFSCSIQEMLTRHFTNTRAILDETERKEKELLYWIEQVSLIMSALEKYQQGIEQKNLQFLEDAKSLFESKVKSLMKINYN